MKSLARKILLGAVFVAGYLAAYREPPRPPGAPHLRYSDAPRYR